MQLRRYSSLARRIDKFDRDPEAERIGQVMACIDSEFFVYVLQVTLDRSDREIHTIGDLAVRPAGSGLEGRLELERRQARVAATVPDVGDRRFDERHSSVAGRGLTRSKRDVCR